MRNPSANGKRQARSLRNRDLWTGNCHGRRKVLYCFMIRPSARWRDERGTAHPSMLDLIGRPDSSTNSISDGSNSLKHTETVLFRFETRSLSGRVGRFEKNNFMINALPRSLPFSTPFLIRPTILEPVRAGTCFWFFFPLQIVANGEWLEIGIYSTYYRLTLKRWSLLSSVFCR